MKKEVNRHILFALIIVTLFLGCRSQQKNGSTEQTATSELMLEPSVLRSALYNFADTASSEIAGKASDIARAAPDTSTRELALLWKLRAATTIQALVLEPDPRLALINTWVATVQHRQYFTQGRGKDHFGEQTVQAADLAYKLEERFEEIVRSQVPPEIFSEAKTNIEKLALEQPIALRSGAGSLQMGNVSRIRMREGVEDILSLPLAPLTGLRGVGTTADALDRMAIILGVITEIVEDMPQHIRWQIEALVLELESGRSMEELRVAILRTDEHIAALMNETKKVVDVVEKLPDEVDRQRKETLDKLTAERTAMIASANDVIATQTNQILKKVDKKLQTNFERFGVERQATLGDAESRLNDVVDHIFWRLVQLVCMILVGLGLLFYVKVVFNRFRLSKK
ncbi:MAG: hypothetical protein ACYSWP_01070 [Planctomycetota bacterium]|jgi:hypothetical protein